MNTPTSPLLASTWRELRRRKVVRAALAYVVVAWVALQVAEVTFEPLGFPPWAMTWAVLAAILGLPVVLVLAWYFEATPRGLALESERPGSRAAGRLFIVATVLLAVGGVGVWLAQVYRPGGVGRAAGAAPPNSIAVLPFEDMSADGDQGWLGDGIAEELLDRLAKMPGLRVAARTSAFALRDQQLDIAEIGRRLNVGAVLEGSVRKADGRIRVTAQLIDAADGFHLWSEVFERPDRDIFAVQDEITAAIAEQLQVRIGRAPPGEPPAGSEATVRAHELYLEARQYWRQRTPDALARAEDLFRHATRHDDRFARAWAGLADTYLLQAEYGSLPPDEAIRLAEPAAVQAVSLDPQLGEAWASLGLLRMNAGQLQAAKGNLLQAMKLDPRYEMAPMWLARIHGLEGNLAEQRRVLEQAHAINPHEPVIVVNLAQERAAIGEVDAARELIATAQQSLPQDPALWRALAAVEGLAGRLDHALRAADQALAAGPDEPNNLATAIDVRLDLEDYDGAAALAERLPPGSRARILTRQSIALRRGEAGLDDGLAARVAPLLHSQRDLVAAERADLTLAGWVLLVGGDAEQAVRHLVRAAGSPERLGREVDLLDPASLLMLALREDGRAEEAAAWESELLRVGDRWLADAGTGGSVEYLRAMFALARGDRAASIVALERAYAAGFRGRWVLQHDPRLAAVREEPRVRALYARIGEDLARMRRAAGAG